MTTFTTAQGGVIYLLVNEKLDARKIGIANTPQSRLAAYSDDWSIAYVAASIDGRLLKRTEQSVLSFLQLGYELQPILTRVDLPAGGCTETFSLSHGPDTDSIITLLDALLGFAPDEV